MKNRIPEYGMEESIAMAKAMVECIELAADSDSIGCDDANVAIVLTARKAKDVIKHIQNLYYEEHEKKHPKLVDVG
jgi:hypothetical protein